MKSKKNNKKSLNIGGHQKLTSRDRRLQTPRGTYEAQRWLAVEEAEELGQEAKQTTHSEACLLYYYTLWGFGHAVDIAKIALSKEATPAKEFIASQVRLSEYTKRMNGLNDVYELLKSWPMNPATTFGWEAGDSALKVAIKFTQTINGAVTFARNEIALSGSTSYDSLSVSPVPDQRFTKWCKRTIHELQTKLNITEIWPSMGFIHRDYKSLLSVMKAEHQQALETSGKEIAVDITQQPRIRIRPTENEKFREKIFMEYDVFICHTSEDKKDFVKPLADALAKENLKVWYDKFELTLGDSLREKIDYGLANSRYGVVVLSKAFFEKPWPKSELDGLVSRQNSEGKKVILPIWYKVRYDEVKKFSPMLAGKLAARSKEGLEAVVAQIVAVCKEEAPRTVFTKIETQPSGEVVPPSSIGNEAKNAVENARPNQVLLVRKFMEWLIQEMDTLAPDFSKQGERDDLLIESINQTMEPISNFARLTQSIAIMNASEPALALYRSFDKILTHYYLPRGVSGIIPQDDFDFYKFIGHEFFVTFISLLIRENRWELIADVLEEEIYLDNRERGQAGMVSFPYISKRVGLLGRRNERLKLRRISVHADILKERHSREVLCELVPMQQFMCADYFLFLRAEFEKPDQHGRPTWNAWSTIFLPATPPYIEQATRKKYAQKLLRPLSIDSIEMFRSKLVELKAAQRLARIFGDPFFPGLDDPLEDFNPQDISTR